MALGSQLKHAWNAFRANEEDRFAPQESWGTTASFGSIFPGRSRVRMSTERSIVASIYNTMANDFASVAIRHVRLDDDDRFVSEIKSNLNNCLRLKANLDQGARAFRQDIAMTLFEEGVIAIVPVDTTLDPNLTGGWDILTARVGKVVQWRPRHVKVSVYDDRRGIREELWLQKTDVAIIENPFYAVMNETNSTLQRLIRKLNILDAIDEQSGSGKLDLIIQLPYVIKSDQRRQQAEQRRKDIEFQLKGSQYGIAYTDGTEKITQLNRPSENNLMNQIEYLVSMLYGQLGLTPEIMNGTATEEAMLNYYNRTIEPLLDVVIEAMTDSFLTKTARSQGQAIKYFRDPFKLVPVGKMADIADKFTRNEILSSNEVRQFMGIKPSKDPKADRLVNSNMPQSDTGVAGTTPTGEESVMTEEEIGAVSG